MVETTAIKAFPRIEGVVDRYKGLEIIDLSTLPEDEETFDKQLAFNLELWR